eukprot:TRINITY_DN4852_c0_g1_i4.p1 TRINITY_DN4852_c0_g1~~TRINITY_DN4852_c0_g1_i4.p1  ORF type:complete len:195 (-),score=-28.78 TRINITY_DN4852_c0_g1_i4:400-984(-)
MSIAKIKTKNPFKPNCTQCVYISYLDTRTQQTINFYNQLHILHKIKLTRQKILAKTNGDKTNQTVKVRISNSLFNVQFSKCACKYNVTIYYYMFQRQVINSYYNHIQYSLKRITQNYINDRVKKHQQKYVKIVTQYLRDKHEKDPNFEFSQILLQIIGVFFIICKNLLSLTPKGQNKFEIQKLRNKHMIIRNAR